MLILGQKTGMVYPKALARLRKMHDSMRAAIGEDIEPRLRGMLQGHAEAAFLDIPPSAEPAGGNAMKSRARKASEPGQPVR